MPAGGTRFLGPGSANPGPAHYWLVSSIPGTPKVLIHTGKPSGGWVVDLGTVNTPQKQIAQEIAKALQGAPRGVSLTGKVSIPKPAKDSGGIDTLFSGIASDVGSIFSTVADGITSSLDFLKLIGWLFHPRNILRAVEFVIGIVLMGFGFQAAWQGRGERLEGFTTSESALSRAGLGRVARAVAEDAGGGRHRPETAPHKVRREALRQRYTREERVRKRERKGEKPAGHAGKTKGSGAGTKKAVKKVAKVVK